MFGNVRVLLVIDECVFLLTTSCLKSMVLQAEYVMQLIHNDRYESYRSDVRSPLITDGVLLSIRITST